ncbi:MAG: addiction module toxin, HicA family [Dehalococcoidia bacterium]|nr:addiction module toxin, HicA family [Dehalococcoidia bacterium]
MAQRLPRLTSDEVVRILRRHGVSLISQRGSHQKWRHSIAGRQVIVPYHRGRQLPLGPLDSIIEGSGIPMAECRL